MIRTSPGLLYGTLKIDMIRVSHMSPYLQSEGSYLRPNQWVTCEGLKSIQRETGVHIGVRGIRVP